MRKKETISPTGLDDEDDLTAPVVDRRGRETGTLVAGSLPWQLAQLEPGGSALFPDGPNRAQQLAVAIKRYSAAHGGQYTLQACGGIPLTAPDASSFRFFRILRSA